MCYKDNVMVLLSTYNGEKYLREQLDSILCQKDITVAILVRDDGSTDNTTNILEEYKCQGLLEWYSGDNLKPARSFMNLLKTARESDYYAFCDQDDVWLPEKLKCAVEMIKKEEKGIPVLYYGATILVDQSLVPLEHSGEYSAFTSFDCAVVSSNATGCTMVFNGQLRDLMNRYSPEYQIMHDGWLHKVCLAVGGKVIYDTTPHILYRQHGGNVVGGSSNPIKRCKRRIDTIKNNSRPRSRGICELYKGYKDEMTEENRNICKEIIHYNDSLLNRLKLVRNKKIYSPNKRIDHIYRLTVLMGLF